MAPFPGLRRILKVAAFALLVFGTHGAAPASLGPFQRVTLLSGEPFVWNTNRGHPATVFIFLSTDCPISNSYAPELQRIQSAYSLRDVQFWAVYCEPTETPESVRRHLKEYQLTLPGLRDPRQELAQTLKVSRTPEAAVIDSRGQPVYRGRIDDRHLRLGQSRPEATTHELRDVLDAVLGGRPIPVAETVAVGCHLPPLP